jgi:hypothetical protein
MIETQPEIKHELNLKQSYASIEDICAENKLQTGNAALEIEADKRSFRCGILMLFSSLIMGILVLSHFPRYTNISLRSNRDPASFPQCTYYECQSTTCDPFVAPYVCLSGKWIKFSSSMLIKIK